MIDDIVVFITTAGAEEAQRIANVLLNERKAACINIVPKISSSFWWQGKLQSAEESLLIVKTKASALAEVVNLVKKHHGYDVPEVIALPIIGGNEDYLGWVSEEVK
jgi:periplasmic divalent cation tolerance protein